MADILNRSTIGIKQTHIMYRANLSYEQILRYLGELQETGLLERRIEEGTALYRTTERGREFLRHFSQVTELMNKRPEEPAARYTPSLSK